MESNNVRRKGISSEHNNVASDESDEDERMARVKSVVLDKPLKPLQPRDARTVGRLI